MKREAPGVGGAAAHFSKNARSGAPSQFCILQALKNEGRYNRDAEEGGPPALRQRLCEKVTRDSWRNQAISLINSDNRSFGVGWFDAHRDLRPYNNLRNITFC